MNRQIKLPASQTAAARGQIVLRIKSDQQDHPAYGLRLLTALVYAELEDLSRVEGQPWSDPDIDAACDRGQMEDTIEALTLQQAGSDPGPGWTRTLDEWPAVDDGDGDHDGEEQR